jgi:DNA-binding protein HU-beta
MVTKTKVKTVTKMELVKKVAEQSKMTKKEALNAINGVTTVIREILKKGEKVQLIPFGTFEVRKRAAREGRNPRTGDKIKIKAHKVPAFRPGKALRDAVK